MFLLFDNCVYKYIYIYIYIKRERERRIHILFAALTLQRPCLGIAKLLLFMAVGFLTLGLRIVVFPMGLWPFYALEGWRGSKAQGLRGSMIKEALSTYVAGGSCRGIIFF